MTSVFDSDAMQVAVAAVTAAGRITRSVQADLEQLRVVTKDDRSPVTLADYAAQAVVAQHLASKLPDLRLVAEERADGLRAPEAAPLVAEAVKRVRTEWPEATQDSLLDAIDLGTAEPSAEDGFWTLDPVDGTKGFLRGQHYAISLARVEGTRPVLGVLACPNLDPDPVHPLSESGRGIVLAAVRGEGVRWRPMSGDGPWAEIRRTAVTSDVVRTCESVESGHSNHDAHAQILRQAGLTGEAVRLDSQAKYAVVARGQADVYLRLPSRKDYVEKIWDHAAGACVAEESGAIVTDFLGRALDFSQGRRLEANRGVVVADAAPHARLIEAIRAFEP